MKALIREEMTQRLQYWFSILLMAKYEMQAFGAYLNLSCMVDAPQDNRRERLILNLPTKITDAFYKIHI